MDLQLGDKQIELSRVALCSSSISSKINLFEFSKLLNYIFWDRLSYTFTWSSLICVIVKLVSSQTKLSIVELLLPCHTTQLYLIYCVSFSKLVQFFRSFYHFNCTQFFNTKFSQNIIFSWKLHYFYRYLIKYWQIDIF